MSRKKPQGDLGSVPPRLSLKSAPLQGAHDLRRSRRSSVNENEVSSDGILGVSPSVVRVLAVFGQAFRGPKAQRSGRPTSFQFAQAILTVAWVRGSKSGPSANHQRIAPAPSPRGLWLGRNTISHPDHRGEGMGLKWEPAPLEPYAEPFFLPQPIDNRDRFQSSGYHVHQNINMIHERTLAQFEDSSTLRRSIILAATLSPAFAALFVGLRFYTARAILRGIRKDDCKFSATRMGFAHAHCCSSQGLFSLRWYDPAVLSSPACSLEIAHVDRLLHHRSISYVNSPSSQSFSDTRLLTADRHKKRTRVAPMGDPKRRQAEFVQGIYARRYSLNRFAGSMLMTKTDHHLPRLDIEQPLHALHQDFDLDVLPALLDQPAFRYCRLWCAVHCHRILHHRSYCGSIRVSAHQPILGLLTRNMY